jgi:hypothetical protein
MDVGSFPEAYIAGWRSVTGEEPVLVPESPVLVAYAGTVAYMIGFSRGVRDATGRAEALRTQVPSQNAPALKGSG